MKHHPRIYSKVLILSIFGGVQTWRANHYKILNENAELKCDEKNKVHADYKEKSDKETKAYQEALIERQTTINQLSADYETEKAKQKVKVETVIRYVDKIVERDVYRISVLMTMGCNSSTHLSKVEVLANLMQPCPPLQELQGITGKAWALWGVDTVAKYNECALQNDAWIKIGETIEQ